jgi:hypothetical protein
MDHPEVRLSIDAVSLANPCHQSFTNETPNPEPKRIRYPEWGSADRKKQLQNGVQNTLTRKFVKQDASGAPLPAGQRGSRWKMAGAGGGAAAASSSSPDEKPPAAATAASTPAAAAAAASSPSPAPAPAPAVAPAAEAMDVDAGGVGEKAEEQALQPPPQQEQGEGGEEEQQQQPMAE